MQLVNIPVMLPEFNQDAVIGRAIINDKGEIMITLADPDASMLLGHMAREGLIKGLSFLYKRG